GDDPASTQNEAQVAAGYPVVLSSRCRALRQSVALHARRDPPGDRLAPTRFVDPYPAGRGLERSGLTIVLVRHAILGAGGVGGLIGAALARGGADVLLLLRPQTLARHPRRLRVESVALGQFEVEVSIASVLDRDVEVLWVTTKATQLEAALELAPPDHVGRAVVVPLLNGIEHVPTLRARYGRLLAAVFYGESERIEPGLVHQPTPFANVVLGP